LSTLVLIHNVVLERKLSKSVMEGVSCTRFCNRKTSNEKINAQSCSLRLAFQM